MHTVTYSLPERRRHPRTRLQMMLHGIRLDPDGGDVCDTLEMVDISRSGLGAVADRWLYPGQRIVLALPLHAHGGRRSLPATVVRCEKDHSGYRIGLEFDKASVATSAYSPAAAGAA